MLPGQLAMTFAPPVPTQRPPGAIERSAVIAGANNELRLRLDRRWGKGPRVAWAGINPSTADATRDDPTMLREIGFSYRWGFGSLVKVNVFPFRSPSPSLLRAWLATVSQGELGRAAEDAARAIDGCDLFIAAWGAHADPEHLHRWLSWIDHRVGHRLGRRVDWHCLGTNADGSPRHTLSRGRNRIPDDAVPILWRRPDHAAR